MARCPECGEKLVLPATLDRWDRISCSSCRAELEVLNLKPLELEAVDDTEEEGLLDDLEEDLDEAEELEEMDDLEWDDEEGDEEDEEDEEDEDQDW